MRISDSISFFFFEYNFFKELSEYFFKKYKSATEKGLAKAIKIFSKKKRKISSKYLDAKDEKISRKGKNKDCFSI